MVLNKMKDIESLNSIDAIILAGGKATRMGGTDKAVLEISGKQVIQHIAGTLKKIFNNIIVVTNTGKRYDIGPAIYTHDEIPYLGPLGGILAGIKSSSSNHSFVVACDMPFIDARLIENMYSQIDDNDIVVSSYNGKIEPLFGFYSKNCIEPIEQGLNKNVRKIVDIFPMVRTLIIEAEDKKSFFNINDAKSLEMASKLNAKNKKKQPIERIVSINVNNKEIAKIHCSPYNLDELAVGFLLNDGLVDNFKNIKDVSSDDKKLTVNVTVSNSAGLNTPDTDVIRRTSGCGSVTRLFKREEILPLKKNKTSSAATLDIEKIPLLMKEMLKSSKLYASTGGVHCSALVSLDNELIVVREDIGRHNTFDKLVGYIALNNLNPQNLAVLTTGRVSFEMMYKMILAQIPVVASLTAATDMAVDLAKEFGVRIIGYVRGSSYTVYTPEEGV